MQIGTLLPPGVDSVARRAVLRKLLFTIFEIGRRLRGARSRRGLLTRGFLTRSLDSARRIQSQSPCQENQGHNSQAPDYIHTAPPTPTFTSQHVSLCKRNLAPPPARVNGLQTHQSNRWFHPQPDSHNPEKKIFREI